MKDGTISEETIDQMWRNLEELAIEAFYNHSEHVTKGMKREDKYRGLTEKVTKDTSSIFEIIIKEMMARTRNEIGGESILFFSNNFLFLQRYSKATTQHFYDIAGEIAEGKFKVPHGVKNMFDAFDIEYFREIAENHSSNLFETTPQGQFVKAYKAGELKKARKLLEAMKALDEDKPMSHDRAQLLNWEVDLACTEGDVEKYLGAIRQFKGITDEGFVFSRDGAKKSIQILLGKVYLNGIAVGSASELRPDQARSINEMFYRRVETELSDVLLSEETPTKDGFDNIVFATTQRVADSISKFHPEQIEIMVAYKKR